MVQHLPPKLKMSKFVSTIIVNSAFHVAVGSGNGSFPWDLDLETAAIDAP